MAKGCALLGCDRVVVARGWCRAHYRRVMKDGHPGSVDVKVYDSSRMCSIEGCSKTAHARGLCNMHYLRVWLGKDVGSADTERYVLDKEAPCAVKGCGRRVHTRKWCQAHYFRVLRNGDAGVAPVREGSAECQMPTCERPIRDGGQGYCGLHYQRVRSHGNPNVVLPNVRHGSDNVSWRGADVNYGGAHMRVRKSRGSAKQYPCVRGCGKQAQQWAYDHQDPDELWSDYHGVPYSQHPHHYLAMCIPCHKRFDLDYLETSRGYMMQPRVSRPGISYLGAHTRARAHRGLVQQYPCVTGCGAQAEQWAYDHRDTEELQDPKHGAPYSGHSHHYLAMCRSCHRRFDIDHSNVANRSRVVQ